MRTAAELFRLLPSVDELLRSERAGALIATYGHTAVLEAYRASIEGVRTLIARDTHEAEVLRSLTALPQTAAEILSNGLRPSLRRVINATGVILHTNLGRAPLAASALAHALEVGGGYSNLEFDLETGQRGHRDAHVDRLLQALLSSASPEGEEPRSLVVNNNAAAVLLMLNTLAEGGEVIVSRGELVEIGGSFRIPEVMTKSGAILREVGTTNRTRVGDYEQAINERTRLLLRVHRSNFQIVGFTEQPTLAELVELGRRRGIPVAEDLGSGALVPLERLGGPAEPTVEASLRAGVDVVTYSGDKLLGGPQAGILSGKAELIRRMHDNPLFRALRVDKLIYSTLEATLLACLREHYEEIPSLRMIAMPQAELLPRAERLAAELANECAELKAEVVSCNSVIGGGSAPGRELPSYGLAIAFDGVSVEELLARLRQATPPVVGRVFSQEREQAGSHPNAPERVEERVLLDLRTVAASEEAELKVALKAAGQRRA